MVGDYVCNMCGKQFMAKKGLSDHNWAVHEQVESPCNFCDKIFRSKKHLAVHISNTHAENPRFSCDFKSGEIACIYYSTTKSNLTAHKKRVHEKTIDVILPKLVCVVCGYRTNSKFNLDRHSEKCNRSLNQNSTDHTCNICSKKFSSKKILTKHTKLHNRSKCDTPISASSCVVCKKTFVNTWNMERHTKKDHGLTEKGNVMEGILPKNAKIFVDCLRGIADVHKVVTSLILKASSVRQEMESLGGLLWNRLHFKNSHHWHSFFRRVARDR